MKKVDMSEEAILRRLKRVDQLRELCLSLMKAKKMHDEKAKEASTENKTNSESVETSRSRPARQRLD
ncbi:MAG TPA: hypothetical protein VK892_17910 [Pyrinomonadaceae bacterium]|nr:hypothetical protein [Pyrinomonadaceae bacterium]